MTRIDASQRRSSPLPSPSPSRRPTARSSAQAAMTPAAPSEFSYPGGKGLDGVFQWIISKMPTHSFYVEPFAGKGAIFRRKPPALVSVLIDRDHEVFDWWHRLSWPAVTTILGDGIHWLRVNGRSLGADALVYCDPPYLPETRSKKRIYRFEMSSLQHRQFLRCTLALKCPCMISGYASTLYDGKLAGWLRFEHEAITRGGVTRTEVLWCNFDHLAESPALAVSYERLGHNFRERERVHRKIKRWVSRLLTLPDD